MAGPDPFEAGPFGIRSAEGVSVVGEGTEDHPHGLGVGKVDSRVQLDRDTLMPTEGPGLKEPDWPTRR
jgi:hypothetical protein